MRVAPKVAPKFFSVLFLREGGMAAEGLSEVPGKKAAGALTAGKQGTPYLLTILLASYTPSATKSPRPKWARLPMAKGTGTGLSKWSRKP